MDQNEKKTENAGAAAPKKNFVKRLFENRRIGVIVIAALVIAVGLIAYLILNATILKDEPEPEQPTIGRHGETMQNGRPFVMEPLEIDRIQKIRVDNDFGGFCYYRGSDDEFYFEGAEALLYGVISSWQSTSAENLEDVMSNISVVDTLFGLSRYMLSTREVENYNPDLSVYGLDGEGKASLTVTFLDPDGKECEETVVFGTKTPSGEGYYVRKLGRDAVYTVNEKSVTRCIFAPINDYLLPQVAPNVSNNNVATVNLFTVKKHGEDFVSFRIMSQEEYDEVGGIFSHVMTVPDGYFPSIDDLNPVFNTLASFVGTSVVEYNVNAMLDKAEEYTEEITEFFRNYNLMDADHKWVYELHYEYLAEGFDITLYISEKMEVQVGEGEEPQSVYFVYSPDFDVIVEFSSETLSWVEWDVLNFMDNHSFATTIDTVSEMTFTYPGVEQTYYLTGEGQQLKVTASNGVAVVTDNFRQLYKAVLFISMDGYAEEPEEKSLLLTVTVKLRNGTVHRYDFYGMTARKAFYTLNGTGEFYINRDYVKQIITANNTLMKGGEVVVNRKN